MKTTQKVTRVQLKVNQKDEYVLMGIVTTEPDYRLSLALNKKLNISLKSSKPVIVTGQSGEEISFSRFSDSPASHGVVFDLISNRSGKSFFLKKLKNVDYIFQIFNPENELRTDEITRLVRSTECVTALFTLDPESLKDRNLQYITR